MAKKVPSGLKGVAIKGPAELKGAAKKGPAELFERKPIVLKRLIQDLKIKRVEIYKATNYSQEAFNYVLNRAGYIPGDKEDYKDLFKCQVARLVLSAPGAVDWLKKEGVSSLRLWEPDEHPYPITRKDRKSTRLNSSH